MKKLSILLFAIVVGVGATYAEEIIPDVQIGNLYYDLYDSSQVAYVTAQNPNSIDNYSYLTSVSIPDKVIYNNKTYGVTGIDAVAFYRCSGLTSVTLPESLMTISVSAFHGCTSLAAINIPSNVVYIANNAFRECTSLTYIELPDSLKAINTLTFRDCTALTTVIIPKGVTTIGNSAFRNCSSLTSVYNYALTPQETGTTAFADVNLASCTLYVPEQSVSAYQNAEVWQDFGTIIGVATPADSIYNVVYMDQAGIQLDAEAVTLHLPVAPEIEGFSFLKWQVVAGDLENGIYIQAVYTANEPTNAPEVYTNPANKAQKLIRNGKVYILTDDKVYSISGQKVK